MSSPLDTLITKYDFMTEDRRNFVFYDCETTGTNIEFDQIIQFSAILTDQNFEELDRINVRCRRLPWVVPSPGAMIVTSVGPSQIDDHKSPQFPEMMNHIQTKLKSWSPAIFIGYNSFQFDEPLLQRALWQSMYQPYITVSNGNGRADLLLLARAVSKIAPHVLTIPNIASNRPIFRLDRLAPSNGFPHTNAHDALGDVEAVIHIAKKIASRAPALWLCFRNCADRKFTQELTTSGEALFFVEPSKHGRSGWWGFPIGPDNDQKSTQLVARLDADWGDFSTQNIAFQRKLLSTDKFRLRRVKENMFPIAFNRSDARELFGISPSKKEMKEAIFLGSFRQNNLLRKLSRKPNIANTETKALEQRIFESFPNHADKKLMREFVSLPWSQRVSLVKKFDDSKLRQIAQRLIFLMAPETLSPSDYSRVKQGIADRLLASHGDDNLWRTIASARHELETLREPASQKKLVHEIESWLLKIEDEAKNILITNTKENFEK